MQGKQLPPSLTSAPPPLVENICEGPLLPFPQARHQYHPHSHGVVCDPFRPIPPSSPLASLPHSLRPDTRETIHKAMEFGVDVKMITGDHLLIAKV